MKLYIAKVALINPEEDILKQLETLEHIFDNGVLLLEIAGATPRKDGKQPFFYDQLENYLAKGIKFTQVFDADEQDKEIVNTLDKLRAMGFNAVWISRPDQIL